VEGNPVFIFHDLINDDRDEVADLKQRYIEGRVGDVEVKEKLYIAHMRKFDDARRARKILEGDMEALRGVLREGASKAAKVANQTLGEVYSAVGIINGLN